MLQSSGTSPKRGEAPTHTHTHTTTRQLINHDHTYPITRPIQNRIRHQMHRYILQTPLQKHSKLNCCTRIQITPEALTHCGTLRAPLPGAPLPGAPLPFPPNLPRDSQRASTLSPAVLLFHPHLSIHQHGPGPVEHLFYDSCDDG